MKSGFTLLELMIAIAIVAILSVIAIPAYMNYTNKAHFSEVIQGVTSYKTAVATCGLVMGNMAQCSEGENGVPIPKWTGHIAKIEIKNGVITGEGDGTEPLNASYIMTPNLQEGGITWSVSGTCVASGLC